MAPFPTKAVVKSHHTLSWVVKQTVCFFVFFPLEQTGHVGIFASGVRGSGCQLVHKVEATAEVQVVNKVHIHPWQLSPLAMIF